MPKFPETSWLVAATMLGIFLGTGSVAAKATYVTFSVGDYDTYVAGINASNTIVGSYWQTISIRSGFARTVDGNVTTFDVPGALLTLPAGINDAGVIAGIYYTPSYDVAGFIRAADGTITTFDLPGTIQPSVSGINNRGEIAGEWGSTPLHGFIRSSGGKFTTFDDPGSDGDGPEVNGLNDKGVVVGRYYDGREGHGFARAVDGTITTIDVAGSDNAGATSINANGEITGWYSDNSGGGGFVRAPDGTITKFTVPGYWIIGAKINRGGMVAANCSGRFDIACIRHPDGKIELAHNHTIKTTAGYLSDTGAIAGSYTVKDSQTHVRTTIGFVRFP